MSIIADNDFTAIERFYQGKTELESLTDHQKKKMDIWDYADNLLRSPRIQSEREAAKQIAVRYSMSIRNAYRDISFAKMLHNSISYIDKDYEAKKALARLEWVLKMAYSSDPPKLREYTRAIAQMIKILGLDKHNENAIPWELLQQHNYFIQFKLEGAKQQFLDFFESVKLPDAKKNLLLDAMEESTEIINPDDFLKANTDTSDEE